MFYVMSDPLLSAELKSRGSVKRLDKGSDPNPFVSNDFNELWIRSKKDSVTFSVPVHIRRVRALRTFALKDFQTLSIQCIYIYMGSNCKIWIRNTQ